MKPLGRPDFLPRRCPRNTTRRWATLVPRPHPHLKRRLGVEIYLKTMLCYAQCFNKEEDVVESGLVMALQLEAHVMVEQKEE
ncbi:hypothetical protein CEXT_281041 [Caerostris extrusa]|uniref:Uncharacterized protein n=1 Tax=Caerostris extrusa TaxID=172846 RepID=A0AAV4XHP4_CAEEX|nr:hypothetical protein CEXT_281041 [Caerostris extrusa]